MHETTLNHATQNRRVRQQASSYILPNQQTKTWFLNLMSRRDSRSCSVDALRKSHPVLQPHELARDAWTIDTPWAPRRKTRMTEKRWRSAHSIILAWSKCHCMAYLPVQQASVVASVGSQLRVRIWQFIQVGLCYNLFRASSKHRLVKASSYNAHLIAPTARGQRQIECAAP